MSKSIRGGEGVANLVRRAGGVATLLAGVGVVFAANGSCQSPLPWPLGWPQGNPEETPPALAADDETDAGAAKGGAENSGGALAA